ncbi:UNVERIFIED_CONTAM: hypothetical protein RMT77_008122 [Armadillidium vulgare]
MWRSSKVLFGLLIVISAISILLYSSRFFGNYFAKYSDENSSFLSRLEGPILAEDPQLVSYLYSNILKPPSAMPYNLTFHRYFSINRPFLRNITFHNFVFDTFKDIELQGFFVEAGALDGETGSNTLWLEYKKNWTGLLIEPDEMSCKALESRHRRAWTSCSCISPQNYAVKSVFEIPNSQSYILSKFWFFRANVRSINSRFHTFKDVIQMAVDEKEALFTYSSIQCFPLITYLLALNVTVVDLLSLDTQGGEKSMLFNFPFEKIKVNYMLIEYFKRGPFPRRKDEELVSYLNSKDFDLIHMSQNSGEYIFKLRD